MDTKDVKNLKKAISAIPDAESIIRFFKEKNLIKVSIYSDVLAIQSLNSRSIVLRNLVVGPLADVADMVKAKLSVEVYSKDKTKLEINLT